jgi:eukaryotic-like serine/threonine-protein kinase
MGAVYKAYDPFLDRTVAIKVLAPHLVWEKDFVERFLREARAAGRLQHPGIIPVYDVGQESSSYYFVMAYLPGPSLKQRIAQKGKLTPDEALPILRQLADALDYAHSEGLIHRDVKPANVMFDKRGQAMLTDFGIVKAVEESRLTGTGASIGTPHYMAPEQVKGVQVSARADQYALAIVTFEMLTGNVPFDATTTTAVLFKQVNDPPPSICKLCTDLPRSVDGVIKRALAKSPDKRYASCGEFVKALEVALAQAVAKPRKPTPTPSPLEPLPTQVALAEARPFSPFRAGSWQGRLMIGGGIGVLVIVGLVIAALAGRPGPATPTPIAAIQPTSSATPAPTSTLQQTSTPTHTPGPPTQTPTSSPTLPASTPVPQPAAVISSDNVNRVTKLAEWDVGTWWATFSPDGKMMALGSGGVSLWAPSSGREMYILSKLTIPASRGIFSPDGALLASGPGDGTVKVWDVASGRELYTLAGHNTLASSVAFSPDGKLLASAGGFNDATIKLWDVASGSTLLSLTGHNKGISAVVFSPDGAQLASGSDDRRVKIWQLPDGLELRTIEYTAAVKSTAFSPDGTVLASALTNGRIELWDVSHERESRTLPGHADQAWSLAFSPDGRILASAAWDATVKLWDVSAGRELRTLTHTDRVLSVAFSPDGRLLASGSADGIVRVWGVK